MNAPREKTINRIKTNIQPFIYDYLQVFDNSGEPEETAEWVLNNYPRMDEKIFLNPGWDKISPLELLILRAMTPPGVFTATAKGSFLSHIQGNTDLCQIAEAVFETNDTDFLLGLPDGCKQYRAKLKTLMMFAYENNIRLSDPRIQLIP